MDTSKAANSQTTSQHHWFSKMFAEFLKTVYYYLYIGPPVVLLNSIRDFFVSAPNIPCQDTKKRSGHVAVVTGEPTGIAFEILKKLLQLDYTVIMGVRNFPVSDKAVEDIRALGVVTGQARFIPLDLKSLASVRQFAKEILQSKVDSRIDLLVNNGGIHTEKYSKTVDGYESIFQVNYLSHFLLTNLLLPRIKKTSKQYGACHIIHTSSIAHIQGNINFSEFEDTKVYNGMQRYMDSKLCIVVSSNYLQKQLDDEGEAIFVNSCHPGIIITNIWNDGWLIKWTMKLFFKGFTRNIDGAANSILYPAFAPRPQGGRYFDSGRAVKCNPQAEDFEIQRRVWQKSMQLSELSN